MSTVRYPNDIAGNYPVTAHERLRVKAAELATQIAVASIQNGRPCPVFQITAKRFYEFLTGEADGRIPDCATISCR